MPLVHEPHRKLEDSRIVRTRDLPETRRAQVLRERPISRTGVLPCRSVSTDEIGVVEDVEPFNAELQGLVLVELEHANEREIDIHEMRTADRVAELGSPYSVVLRKGLDTVCQARALTGTTNFKAR